MKAFCAVLLAWLVTPVVQAAPLSEEIQTRALQYFLDNAHPQSGLVRDRAENFQPDSPSNRLASIAATGFGLTVIAHAGSHGRMDAMQAQDYVVRTLRFCRDHVPRFRGWFLHFIDWETGLPPMRTEYSTIDTALFIAGALYAAQVFPQNAEIVKLANELFEDMDFRDFMTDGGSRPNKRSISMAYTDGVGYTDGQWDMYAEQKLLLVLGLGHPSHPLPADSWLSFERDVQLTPDGAGLMGLEEALFVHQYSEAFVDFRGFDDGFANYFENSRAMTEYHRKIAKTDTRFKTLREGFWGFSAGDDVDGYRVWHPLKYHGTVCLGCTVGSAMFTPAQILSDATDWIASPYGAQIWGRYGFVDSINLDQNWFGSQVLGITVGPEYMALANLDSTASVWKDFMKIPAVQKGLGAASLARQQTASSTQDY